MPVHSAGARTVGKLKPRNLVGSEGFGSLHPRGLCQVTAAAGPAPHVADFRACSALLILRALSPRVSGQA